MRIVQSALTETFAQLRQCGGGRRECVVYLTAAVAEPELIEEVIHPAHTASAVGYDVEGSALAALTAMLLQTRRTVRAQAHTHPGEAYHSARDEEMPLFGSTGFLSLVIPDFAAGPVGFDRAALFELDERGRWQPVAPEQRLEVLA